MTPHECLTKASHGQLTPEDVSWLIGQLEAGVGDTYTLLLALGRGHAKEQQPVVERFLQTSQDPMLVRLAMQILCKYWNLYDHYMDVLIRFMRKVEWDADDDVRLMAIGCVGEALRRRRNEPLLSELLALFSNVAEKPIVREAAYCAIARAVGRDWKHLPPASRHFDLQKDIDASVIEDARGQKRGQKRCQGQKRGPEKVSGTFYWENR